MNSTKKSAVGMKYSDLVNYEALDPIKRLAMDTLGQTLSNPENMGIFVVPETLGATAVAWDLGEGIILAHNVEDLGTKNLIAENMYKQVIVDKKIIADELQIKKLFRNLAIDNAAMCVNDVNGINGIVFSYCDILSTGSSKYLADIEKIRWLFHGYKDAADENGFAVPQGETPELPGIIFPETVDLAGSALGRIPEGRVITGQNIEEGDVIYGFESSGPHANGISKLRKMSEATKDGYFTPTRDDSTIGEKILIPTTIYQRPVREMQKRETEIHFLQPITGHAFEKIARTKLPFDYDIHHVPNSADTEAVEIFNELIGLGKAYNKTVSPSKRFNLTNKENYYVWNMGLGFVAIAPKSSGEDIRQSGEKYGLNVFELGTVKKGERRVIMPFKEGGQRVVYAP